MKIDDKVDPTLIPLVRYCRRCGKKMGVKIDTKGAQYDQVSGLLEYGIRAIIQCPNYRFLSHQHDKEVYQLNVASSRWEFSSSLE